MPEKSIRIIGAGLAGSEAAWQLAKRGISVDLYEMRPNKNTGAHHSHDLAELVCSNSLGAYGDTNASGLLKEEMRLLDSLIISTAWETSVPAGGALAVDREKFAQIITERITKHPLIKLHRQEVENITYNYGNSPITIIATGPLTSQSLADSIKELTGESHLHFFDAAAPILTKDSLDHSKIYAKSRYDKGTSAYLNCPLTKIEYENFWQALINAERVELKDFEKNTPFFEACLPIEIIASRGKDTLRFGPMKPVGLEDPRTGKRPYAVVQLRQDNAAANLYNMVGFQTNLKWPCQKEVFKLIPGLENVEFVRLGVMHRNTYLNSPTVLTNTLNLKTHPQIFFAGQITGVEGYSESTALGIMAAINAAKYLNGEKLSPLSHDTMIGALIRYITNASATNFQPINSNWGILDIPEELAKLDKNTKRLELRKRALKTMDSFLSTIYSIK